MTENQISNKLINRCLAHLEIDLMPFNDIYREINFDSNLNHNPTRNQLNLTLKLIRILIYDYNVICLKGPEMDLFAKSKEESLRKLQKIVNTDNYENYNYGIWFDKNQEEL